MLRNAHFYLLKREEQSQCIRCDTSSTVRHTLLDRDDFSHVKKQKVLVDIVTCMLFICLLYFCLLSFC